MPSDSRSLMHPQTRVALARAEELGLRPIETLSPEDARSELAWFASMRPKVNGECKTDDMKVIAHDGAAIPVRVYLPSGLAAAAPVVVYFHGGGHVVGSIETSDDVARRTALQAGVVVVSVGYRKGPEHRFPTAVHDAWSALLWVGGRAGELGVDASQLAVMGESAGANLATVIALQSRDAGGPAIRTQVLIYPVTDYRLQAPSFARFASGFGVLSTETMRWFKRHYLARREDAADWRASPILAPSLAGLPSALIIAAACDPLVDDVMLYAKRLRAEGVDTRLMEYPGVVHGFYSSPHAIDLAADANDEVAAHLRAALRAPGP